MKSKRNHLAMALFLGTALLVAGASAPIEAKAAAGNVTLVTPVSEDNRIVDTLSFGNASSESRPFHRSNG